MIEAIYHILSTNTTLTTLVVGRIYPLIVPQNVIFPAITLTEVSNTPNYCKEGRAEDEYRLSVNVFSTTYRKTQEISEVTIDILDLLKGTFAGKEVSKIKFVNEFPYYDKEAQIYQKTIDFKVNIKK